MRLHILLVMMLFSCLFAGCTETEIEEVEQALGCTYQEALNYNDSATIDDGSCIYPDPPEPIFGCKYPDALNHNPSATEDDGSCRYPVVEDPIPGCMYSDAYNYEMNATEDDGGCVYDTDGDGIIDDFEESGCTDPNANNHNLSSTDDDGTCDYDQDDDGVYDWAETDGCVDVNATNYDPSATESNQTLCEYPYIMTLDDMQALFLGQEDMIFARDLANQTSFIRVVQVDAGAEQEEGLEGDSNANTTAVEMIIGHDPENEIMYQSMLIRFMGDISMEQTTVQGPEGINYRIGNSNSGSWYYARDDVYQYANPFQGEGDDEGGSSDDDDDTGEGDGEEGDSLCDFEESDPLNWADNWIISYDKGVNTAVASNQTRGLDISLEFVGNPPRLNLMQVSQINGMSRCTTEILDNTEIEIEIDTSLPRTSMTMKIENEVQEDSGSTRTWSADLGEDHFEEVNLTEIVLRVYAGEEESEEDDSGEGSLVTEMILSEQTATRTDQCYQWTMSWADNDNDGYVSAGDAYTVTRTDRVIDPCPDDDEYRNQDFQIMFYDLWADMPTGGVFTPGFGFISAISVLLASSMLVGRRDRGS
ncbi:MAG: hypothetical protein CBD33_01325 [Euryarchaeota archaeon TMED173]|nr:MAG: hypothetical protein CBD33_01325 [Euryarchaeota archaeon TMED173]